MTLRYRSYVKGDEGQIVSLFNAVFGPEFQQHRDQDQWAHDFQKNPLGPSVIYLAIDENDRVVGHYALSRRELTWDDQTINAGLSHDTMVKSEFRGRGIFGKLARRAYQDAADKGIHLVYGFPNDNSKNYFFTKLKWNSLPSLPFRAHPLKPQSLFNGMAGKIAKVFWTPFSDKLLMESSAESSIRETSFEDNVPGSMPFLHGRRDSSFLRWRFSDVSDRQYLRFGFYENGTLAGYIVGRVVKYGELRGGAVVDLWPLNGAPIVLRSLFNYLSRRFKEEDCDVIYSVMPGKTASILGLGRMIQVPGKYQVKTNWFGYLPLDDAKCPLAQLGRSDFWAMTLIDWDIA